MSDKTLIKLFDEKQVRIVWDEQEKKYYFSIVDVVQVLTESTDYQTARKYWNKLKQRLKEEGNEMVTCHQLKLAGGKMFVRVAGPGTIAAHKCWLELDNAKAARQLNIGNDEPTGIDRIDNSQLTIILAFVLTCKGKSSRVSRSARESISATERKSRRAAENAEERDYYSKEIRRKGVSL